METQIPSINLPSTSNPSSDKGIGGLIENLPQPMINIKTGDTLLLNVLLEQDVFSLSDKKIPAEVVINEQKIPLKIVLDTPLKPSIDKKPLEVAIKVTNNDSAKLSFRLVSINGERPENFVSTPLQGKNIDAKATTPHIIKDIGNRVEVELPSVKISNFVEKVATDLRLAPELKTAILNEVKELKISISYKPDAEVLPPSARVLNPVVVKQFFEASQPIKNTLERVQTVLENFAEQKPTEPSPSMIKELVQQIKAEMMPLKSMPLMAEIAVKENAVSPSKPIVVLHTVLGDIVPDVDINIKPEIGSKILLNITDVELPEKNLKDLQGNIKEFVGNHKVLEELFQSNNLLLKALKNNKSEPILEFVKIFEPLNKTNHADLSAKILEKIPSLDNKMLGNMVSFIKAAGNNNISDWLGKEIVSELEKSGVEGKETLSRLQNLVSSNTKEGQIWRVVEIPFFSGDNLSKIKVAIKKLSDDDENLTNMMKREKYGTRFVVDTSFSKLGDFQFDGFSYAKDRKFDLIIRTSKKISEDLYSNILRLFKNTLHSVEYVGNVNINMQERFIKVYDDAPQDSNLKDGIFI